MRVLMQLQCNKIISSKANWSSLPFALLGTQMIFLQGISCMVPFLGTHSCRSSECINKYLVHRCKGRHIILKKGWFSCCAVEEKRWFCHHLECKEEDASQWRCSDHFRRSQIDMCLKNHHHYTINLFLQSSKDRSGSAYKKCPATIWLPYQSK